MAIRDIIQQGDETLRKKSREVTSFDKRLHTLLEDMAETMYGIDGAGLAACQVGVLRRVVVIDTGEGLLELVNPEIISTQGEQIGPEGCLSCPDVRGFVRRPAVVTVQARNRNGELIEVTGEQMMARALCHEVEHLEGKLFVERIMSDEELIAEGYDPKTLWDEIDKADDGDDEDGV